MDSAARQFLKQIRSDAQNTIVVCTAHVVSFHSLSFFLDCLLSAWASSAVRGERGWEGIVHACMCVYACMCMHIKR